MADILIYENVKKNTAFNCAIALGGFTAGPTINAGDVKVSIDFNSFNNITNLPTSTPPGTRLVEVQLTAAEMNGDFIVVQFVSGSASWADAMIFIRTSTRIIDDLTYPTYQLPDSVPADGSIPNLQQAIYMIVQWLNERTVAGTTLTVKKVDGATTLMTFQLNDATNPTSITRLT